MTLMTRETPPQVVVRRQLVRLALLTSSSSVAFVIVLALAAWWKRDAEVGVPRDPVVTVVVLDAGPHVIDAGFAAPDAGELVTVALDVDAGPAQVTPPPVDAAALAVQVGVVAQRCLEDALRFDPSLGGKATLTLALGAHEPARAQLTGISSPLFSRCLIPGVEALAFPVFGERLDERIELRVTLALDGLRSAASVTSAELVMGVTRP